MDEGSVNVDFVREEDILEHILDIEEVQAGIRRGPSSQQSASKSKSLRKNDDKRDATETTTTENDDIYQDTQALKKLKINETGCESDEAESSEDEDGDGNSTRPVGFFEQSGLRASESTWEAVPASEVRGAMQSNTRWNVDRRVLDHWLSEWKYWIESGFNVLLHGFGSKRRVLQHIRESWDDYDCVVANGFFPSLTAQEVLSALSLLSSSRRLLLVHNLERLRDSHLLLQQDGVRIIASVDHVSAPLRCACAQWLWTSVNTFSSYEEESCLESFASDTPSLSAMLQVISSLPSNARRMFVLLAEHQLSESQGMAITEWYWRCREELLAASEGAFRQQMTEFRDHKLLRMRKGGEWVSIVAESATLREFLSRVDAQ